MTYTWTTREDGAILVEGQPLLVLPRAEEAVLARIETQWGMALDRASDKYRLRHGWLRAMVYRESAGNARAYRQERMQDGTAIVRNGRPLAGIGLLQITDPELKGGLTDEALYNVDTNLDIGGRYVSSLALRYGDDFPRVSAAFNVGSARRGADPWGLFATAGHVDAEVRALNTWTLWPLDESERAAVLASLDWPEDA